MNTDFSTRMALAVKTSGLTLQKIADLAGTSKGQVSQWQTKGKVQVENIKAHVLERICSALNICPRWLMYGDEPMRPAKTAKNEAQSLWDAYQKLDPATRAAIDILLAKTKEEAPVQQTQDPFLPIRLRANAKR